MKDLTHKQLRVLVLVSHGKTNAEVAEELGCTDSTVKVHLKTMQRKLDCRNRTEMAALYWQHHFRKMKESETRQFSVQARELRAMRLDDARSLLKRLNDIIDVEERELWK